MTKNGKVLKGKKIVLTRSEEIQKDIESVKPRKKKAVDEEEVDPMFNTDGIDVSDEEEAHYNKRAEEIVGDDSNITSGIMVLENEANEEMTNEELDGEDVEAAILAKLESGALLSDKDLKKARKLLTKEEKNIQDTIINAVRLQMVKCDGCISLKLIKKYPPTSNEINSLVKEYYSAQKTRIASGNRMHAQVIVSLIKSRNEEHKHITVPLTQASAEYHGLATEKAIAKTIAAVIDSEPVARWMLSIKGIGPMYAAGLLTYINIDKAYTAGSLWSYAGITGDPEHDERHAGQKIMYNKNFKVLMYKIGCSFMYVQNKGSLYGRMYQMKLAYYMKHNEAGDYKERAAEILQEKNFTEGTVSYKAYAQGKLPYGHMISMARRFAEKIFLAHLFEVWKAYSKRDDPTYILPRPYVNEILGHVHIYNAPNKNILLPGEKSYTEQETVNIVDHAHDHDHDR